MLWRLQAFYKYERIEIRQTHTKKSKKGLLGVECYYFSFWAVPPVPPKGSFDSLPLIHRKKKKKEKEKRREKKEKKKGGKVKREKMSDEQ